MTRCGRQARAAAALLPLLQKCGPLTSARIVRPATDRLETQARAPWVVAWNRIHPPDLSDSPSIFNTFFFNLEMEKSVGWGTGGRQIVL